MYYVCIENNTVIGIQNYEPEVPLTVEVIQISDEDNQKIFNQTHKFDVPTRSVIPLDNSIINEREIHRLNAIEREFLNRTDWKILRHIRQKALNIPTSLTDEEYLQLENMRHDAASRVISL